MIAIYPALQEDMVLVNSIREPFYERKGLTIEDPPNVKWLIARNGKAAAVVGLLDDWIHKQRWVLDLLGSEGGAYALNELREHIQRQALEEGIRLVGWQPADSRHLRDGLKHGWRVKAFLMEFN